VTRQDWNIALAISKDGGLTSNRWLRIAVFAMAALYTAAMLWVSFMLFQEMKWPGPSISKSIALKIFMICAWPYILCAVPAAALAILNRRLWLTLLLCIMAMPLGAAIGFSIA
jgi:hypothetical protein